MPNEHFSQEYLTLINRLPFEWDDLVYLDAPIGQPITDVCGRILYAADVGVIPSGGSVSVAVSDLPVDLSLKFDYDEAAGTVHTRYLTVKFDEDGFITSLIHGPSGKELCRSNGVPLNRLTVSEGNAKFLGRTLSACGAYELRIRSEYALGNGSRLTQDMIFNGTSARINFHTRIDIGEQGAILGADFDTAICPKSAAKAKAQRLPVLSSSSGAVPQWAGISDGELSVILLNADGSTVSAEESTLKILLQADKPLTDGTYETVYSLILQDGHINTEAAARQAYMLGCPPRGIRSKSPQTF